MDFLHEMAIGILSRLVWTAIEKAGKTAGTLYKQCTVCDDPLTIGDHKCVCWDCERGLLRVFPR